MSFPHQPQANFEPQSGAATLAASPTVPWQADEGTDLLDTAIVLVRGWKVLLVAAVAGAAVGGGLWFSQAPSRHVAALSLTVPPDPAAGTGAALAAVRPVPELLQGYARKILSEDSRTRIADAFAAEHPDLAGVSTEQIKTAVTVTPANNEPRLLLSAVLTGPAEAEALARAAGRIGIEVVNAYREKRSEEVRRELERRRDWTAAELRRQQLSFSEVLAAHRPSTKCAVFNAVIGRLKSLQEATAATEVQVATLDAQIHYWEETLGKLPDVGKPAIKEPSDPLWAPRLAAWLESADRDPDAPESPKLTREGLEHRLFEDRASLVAARAAHEEALKTLPAVLKELEAAQTAMDESTREVRFAERTLQSARDKCEAADESLSRWSEEFDRQFPPLAVDPNSPLTVKAAGQSRVSRLVAVEMVALLLGCMVVMAIDAYKRRAARRRSTLSTTDACPPSYYSEDAVPHRLSA